MKAYDFVHLVLHAAGDRIHGRTKLQKMVYFAGALTDKLNDLGYRPHFYGPYSAAVASAVDQLKGLGFLDQNIMSRGGVDPRGFEIARYDYALTEDGKQVAKEKAAEHPIEWRRILDAVKKLDDANADNYVQLSIAAKAHLIITNQNKPITTDEIRRLARGFGWDVPEAQIDEAGELLTKIELVTANRTLD
jgi:uncharacterized protein